MFVPSSSRKRSLDPQFFSASTAKAVLSTDKVSLDWFLHGNHGQSVPETMDFYLILPSKMMMKTIFFPYIFHIFPW